MAAFLLLNGGALLLAFLVSRAAGLGGRTSQLLLGALVGFLVVAHSSVLLTGLTGHLTVGWVLVGLFAALGLVLWRGRYTIGAPALTDGSPSFGPVALLMPVAAISSAIVWTSPHLFEATRVWIWDDYTYHMVYPTFWLREHSIAAPTPAQAFTGQAWYPLSASVVAAWFMLPFTGSRGEALALVSLTGVLYASIAALGAAELLARTGCRRGAWALPLILFTTSQRIGAMAATFSDADLAQAATLFAAVAFAVPRRASEDERDIRVDTWYAGLLSGFALGVKISAALPSLIVLVMIALRASAVSRSTRSRWLPAARTVLILATAWALTAGYWYARNVIHTGNPLYPAAFLGWPGSIFPLTTLLEYGRHYGLRRTLADALVVYLNWPLVHALLALAGLVGLGVWLASRRGSASRAQIQFASATLAITGLMLILLPVTPYSSGNPMTFRSGLVHWDSMRYVGLLPLLGWAALGFLIDAGAGAADWRTAVALLIGLTAVLTSSMPLRLWAVFLVALLLGTVAIRYVRLRFAGRWRALHGRVAAVTAAVLAAVIIIRAHGDKAAATAAAFYREPLFGRAIAVLDTQPAGTRVAIFGDQWVYPTFGALGHLVPVRLDRNGQVATLPIGDAFEPGDLTADPPTFRANLRASGVGLVVLVRLPHPGRPADLPRQHAALETIDDARLLYRDAAVAIWRLGS